MSELAPCPGCGRHVRRDEAACPFCGADAPAAAPTLEPEPRSEPTPMALTYGPPPFDPKFGPGPTIVGPEEPATHSRRSPLVIAGIALLALAAVLAYALSR